MNILLADDDLSLRRVLQFKLQKAGYDVTTVANGAEALKRLREDRWDLLLSDIKMPEMDGIELLELAGQIQPDLKVILLTAYATVSQAVEAVKLGAFDYITKPFDDDELMAAIKKATAFRELEEENKRLKQRIAQSRSTVRMIGVSRPFKEMMKIIDKIAATDATVLLFGPSGTGKELAARAIHGKSNRAGENFIAVNCGAIPRELIESELFGHVKGSFTGAVKDKKGKFELANGGTILLDEVSELAMELQVRLLRVLQERVIEPVGSESIKPIDVRVIGSTNVDLQQRVAEGKFREDLFFRLNVIPIKVPSLAERIDDLPLLVREFTDRYAPGRNVTVSPDLLERLARHTWPGNIRELENLIERMVILSTSDALTTADLPADFGNAATAPPASIASDDGSPMNFHQAEEKIVRDALERCGWNKSKAAKQLEIPRHVLLYRMKKYNIKEP